MEAAIKQNLGNQVKSLFNNINYKIKKMGENELVEQEQVWKAGIDIKEGNNNAYVMNPYSKSPKRISRAKTEAINRELSSYSDPNISRELLSDLVQGRIKTRHTKADVPYLNTKTGKKYSKRY